MSLDKYNKKRDFGKSPEPKGNKAKSGKSLQFVIQKHDARNLHYDLRLEMSGVLKSWAVPKGPSMNPDDKRLAVETEDHPMKYLKFEGTIPKGNYGAGEMEIWDSGTYEIYDNKQLTPDEQWEKGDIKIEFFGKRIQGAFALVRTRRSGDQNHWLLIKKKDKFSTDLEYDIDKVELDSDSDNSSEMKSKSMIQPMLASQSAKPFSKNGWIYEIKWDGYRLLSNIDNGKVQIYSRNGISYNMKFPKVLKSLKSIEHEAIIDGEVVVLDKKGNPDFQALQNYDENTPGELKYYVFDLLYLNGEDITHLPLIERKSLIPTLIEDLENVQYCDHVDDMGIAFFEKVTAMGLEGIIAKKSDSKYVPGSRSSNWLKVKGRESMEAIICGYTDSDNSSFGSLILGIQEEGELKYIGNCGTGFNENLKRQLLNEFKALEIDKSPFIEKINLKGRSPVWVKPSIICEVKFSAWTESKRLRHPVFKAIREDKSIKEISTPEVESPPKKSKTSTSQEDSIRINNIDVSITNLDKIYWPKEEISKYQLIDYYLQMSEFILPFLLDRPQNLHRHPNGITGESFYQKDTAGNFPDWIKTVSINSESANKDIEYMLCQNEATLLYMANLGCIEINPWNSRTKNLDNPDYTVIDLDPADKNTFEEIIEVAQTAHEILEFAGINSYCKTSGSKGLHIYIPLKAKYNYDEARDFTKLICHFVNDQLPKITTLERSLKKRKGRIYLDYLQNRRGQTLAAPYCVRPKPNATVSAPLEWREVKSGLKLEDFNIFTMPERVVKKPELFKDVLKKGNNIEKALEKLEEK